MAQTDSPERIRFRRLRGWPEVFQKATFGPQNRFGGLFQSARGWTVTWPASGSPIRTAEGKLSTEMTQFEADTFFLTVLSEQKRDNQGLSAEILAKAQHVLEKYWKQVERDGLAIDPLEAEHQSEVYVDHRTGRIVAGYLQNRDRTHEVDGIELGQPGETVI